MSTMDLEPLRTLLRAQTIAALGTLHHGEPAVSMVPFALDEQVGEFVVHVSGLASHTRDMLDHPRVSLLVVAPDDGGRPQARARATMQGDALPLAPDSDRHAMGRTLYLRRFPQSVDTFALPDFSLFSIRPASVRFVGGFAQAMTLTAEQFERALRGH